MAKSSPETAKLVSNDSLPGVSALVLTCFFLSGLSGLVYEILWTRMIVKVIGGAPFAVSIILTVFMAGLGLGSYIAGCIIDRFKKPLKLVQLYGILELAVGAYCLLLPSLLAGFKPIFAVLYNLLFDHFMLYTLLTFVGCTALLIVPVTCMGATLPILCRFYVTKLAHLGTHAGRLYGLNTIGAAVGALLCGFWLLNLLGVSGTLAFAVILNVLIGLVAIIAGYTFKTASGLQPKKRLKESSFRPQSAPDEPAIQKSAAIAALVIFAVSGFCSMAYEVIWTKLLALIAGPTTYSFTVVLVTFITCLALGSILFGSLADKVKNPLRLLLQTQVIAAVLVLFVSHLLGNSQFFFAKLIYHFRDNFAALNISKTLVLFASMLAPTVCLGATFPLVGKIYTPSVSKVGRSFGFAYAINTIGAVSGSFAAGFLLVPFVGKENGLRLTAGLQILTAVLIAALLLVFTRKNKLLASAALAPAGFGLVLCFFLPKWDPSVLAYGRYHRQTDIINEISTTGWIKSIWAGSDILARQQTYDTVFSRDGISGFTTVMRYEDAFGNINFTLMLSGKPDASTSGDMATQTLSAHIPMLFHPQPKTVMVLGYASGVTAGETLCYPIEKLDILEISPDVVVASKFFNPWNSNVLSNSKTELIVQDGRAHLQLTTRKYDVIISEPSNPWMAGLAVLFTQDFFELAKEKLNVGGIFTQFFHSYQMNWYTFAMVCRSFTAVFPNNALVQTGPGDYLLLGFKSFTGIEFSNLQRNITFAQNSKNIRIPDAKMLYRLVKTENLARLAGKGPANTDNFPTLEFAAPKNMFLDDPDIDKNIETINQFTPETQQLKQEVESSVDSQLDFLEFSLSVNIDDLGMVDLSRATEAQRQRFFKLVESYCANHEIEYDQIKDDLLKSRCLSLQLSSLKDRLDKNKNKLTVHYALSALYRQKGDLSNACLHYSKILQINPGDIITHGRLALALAALGKIDEAIEQCRIVLKARPDDAEMHTNLGILLQQQGKLDEAIQSYRKALQINPAFQKALDHLNSALAQKQKLR